MAIWEFRNKIAGSGGYSDSISRKFQWEESMADGTLKTTGLVIYLFVLD